MRRKLIIDGNAVYELDENCMLMKKMDQEDGFKGSRKKDRKGSEKKTGKRTE